eukprot:GHUV01013678.1.p1 GENE.GHUV01013678.1~~GHUV01013678.1.p1  ORF type:complete len:161 (-),score=18.88 GHUV01013678.1:2507-2989(-)
MTNATSSSKDSTIPSHCCHSPRAVHMNTVLRVHKEVAATEHHHMAGIQFMSIINVHKQYCPHDALSTGHCIVAAAMALVRYFTINQTAGTNQPACRSRRNQTSANQQVHAYQQSPQATQHATHSSQSIQVETTHRIYQHSTHNDKFRWHLPMSLIHTATP